MATPVSQPTPPEKRSACLNPWLLGCVGLPALLLLLGGFGAMMAWNQLMSYAVASDFTEFQAKIRPMELDPAVKKPLLERMERLRDKARHSSISVWRWVDYNESIKSLLDDDRLTPDEVEALNRELDRMEAEFR
jgi:hypothetical protein